MGNALALIGCVGIIIGLIALIRGRMGWARIHSRRVAAIAVAGSVVALVVGATIAAPSRRAVAQPVTAPAAAASSARPVFSAGSATPNPPPVQTTASSGSSTGTLTHQPPVTSTQSAPGSSTTVQTPGPVARSAAAVTAIAADVQQAGARRAVDVLATLAVKGRAPLTGYSRAQFGPAWTDDNDDLLGHNGCDTRNDILRRDLTAVNFKPGTHNCAVLTGTLSDPYTAAAIAFTRSAATSTAVQIDHVVALGDAWQTGAQNLSPQLRLDLANDPLELLAVAGPTNEAKGDGDAATWLPPNKAYRCAYVARQVAVKARYRLWVTAAEHNAIAAVLARCAAQAAPAEAKALPTQTTFRPAPTLPSTSPSKTTTPSPPTPSTSTQPEPPPPPMVPTVQAAVPAPSTPQPTPTAQAGAASGATALCNDGSLSFAAHHQGACSHHGGVATFYH